MSALRLRNFISAMMQTHGNIRGWKRTVVNGRYDLWTIELAETLPKVDVFDLIGIISGFLEPGCAATPITRNGTQCIEIKIPLITTEPQESPLDGSPCEVCFGSGQFGGQDCWHCGGEGVDPVA